MIEQLGLSWRRVYEQSWWIGSELARRQSRLRITETHPGDGLYDCLSIGDDGVGPGVDGTISLNRHGTLHTHGGPIDNLTWMHAVAAESPHDVVRELEMRMRWDVPGAPPTTPRSLAYRAISRLLTRTLNDREEWRVRQASKDNHWLPVPIDDLRRRFPQASSTLEGLVEGRPGAWAILRNGDPAALVIEDGTLHRASDVVDLMPVYRGRRRLDDVVDLVAEV